MKAVFLFPSIAEMSAIHKSRARGGKIYHIQEGPNTFSYLCSGPGRHTIPSMQKNFALSQEIFFVMIGYAGGVRPELQTGDVVFCTEFLCQDNESLQSSFENETMLSSFAQAGIRLYRGPSFTSTKVVSSPLEKDQLREQGAYVVEMENYWGAQVACRMGVPFLALRIVLDTYSNQLPDLGHLVKSNGETSILHSIIHLFQNPQHLGPMLKIYGQTQKIAPILANCCRIIASSIEG